jgi:hypothetical protein|tara:strand:- start:245 stop:490 length:246 start_codon:yes stop_codon:yes gene_type:complete
MKTKKDFINTGANTFIDIDSELKREYVFTREDTVVIENPIKLCVKPNGHRVWDAQNVSHYIPSGWIHLRWQVKEGEPNFVK